MCFPPPSSDLKTATFKGILQIRRQDRVAAADSPRRKKCGKWIEILGKFGPRTRLVPLPPLLKKIRIDESDKNTVLLVHDSRSRCCWWMNRRRILLPRIENLLATS